MRSLVFVRRSRRLPVSVAAAVVSLAALGLLILAGCGGGGSQVAPPKDVFTLGTLSEYAGGWDPRASGGIEGLYLINTYEPLLRANPPGSVEPFEPVLATSWEVSDDGLTWTFKLRKGVKFHDGTVCDAAAVKYSMDATKELGQGVAYILDAVKSVDVVDDQTVRFVLSSAVPLDRILSSIYAVNIFSPATAGKPSDWWIGKSYGTGPYKIQSYQPGEQSTYVRFDEYWGGQEASPFKKVVVRIAREPGTLRQMLEAGEVDFIYDVDNDTVAALEANPDLEVQKVTGFLQFNVVFNTLRPPLDNVKVRQALAYATPYDDIIKVGVNGLGTKSVGMVPRGLFPFNPDLPTYSYDLDKARQLLAEAGYPDGKGIHKLQVMYWSTNAYHFKYAPLVKEAWEKIGVQVELQPTPSEQGYARATTGPEKKRQDVMLDSQYPSFADGQDMLWYQWHSQEVAYNWSYWSSDETDRLMDEALALESTDLAKAQEMYDACQKLLIENVPCAPMFDIINVTASRKSIELEEGALNPYYSRFLFWQKVKPATGS